jgi:hypothetical protein
MLVDCFLFAQTGLGDSDILIFDEQFQTRKIDAETREIL